MYELYNILYNIVTVWFADEPQSRRPWRRRLRELRLENLKVFTGKLTSGKTTTGDIPGYPGITRSGVYPGITRDNPKQKTCNGISQDKNLVLGYPGISWDISRGDNLVQGGI